MWHRFWIFLILCAVSQPLQATAQPWAVPQPAPWPDPWFMWGDGWPFWWICPLMMLAMMLACSMMFFGHRSSGGH